MISAFLSGAVMLACAAIGLFFLRSWRRTSDRLFGFFALAFLLLAAERWVLVSLSPAYEFGYSVFLIRLAAFVVILIAIVDKNRSGSGRGQPP
jgi:hypothetical protein